MQLWERGRERAARLQRGAVSFCCVACTMGFELFGDSQGRVQVFEKNVHQSTVDVLTPPTDSALLDGQPGALDRFQENCGSAEIVAIVPFARGFAAVTAGGYLAVCGVLRRKCGAAGTALDAQCVPALRCTPVVGSDTLTFIRAVHPAQSASPAIKRCSTYRRAGAPRNRLLCVQHCESDLCGGGAGAGAWL